MHEHDDLPYLGPPKRIMLAEAQNWRCAYCSIELDPATPAGHDDSITLDEVVPRAAGGRRHWSNQVVACRLCNNGRSAMRATRYAALVALHGRLKAPKVRLLGFLERRRRSFKAMAAAHDSIWAPQLGVRRGPPPPLEITWGS